MVGESNRRALRTSFDETADAYDRTRPVAPDALFDDLVELGGLAPGSRVLEIGCGTGQATLPLAGRGLRITAIEPGARLADIARAKLSAFASVEVLTVSFEDWKPDRAVFDAVVAVNSLHWIDPRQRFAKPGRVLRPGGAMVVVSIRWAASEPPDPFLAALEEDYRAVGYPGEAPPAAGLIDPWHFPPEADGLFAEEVASRYRFSVTFAAADFVANLATQSTTHQLGPAGAGDFLGRVRRRMAGMGVHEVERPFVGLLTIGRRLDRPSSTLA